MTGQAATVGDFSKPACNWENRQMAHQWEPCRLEESKKKLALNNNHIRLKGTMK